jgi:hypothetical protein
MKQFREREDKNESDVEGESFSKSRLRQNKEIFDEFGKMKVTT